MKSLGLHLHLWGVRSVSRLGGTNSPFLSPNLEYVETEGVMLLYHVAESGLPRDFYCHLATLGLLFIASPLLFPVLERVIDVPAVRGRCLRSLCFCLKLEA